MQLFTDYFSSRHALGFFLRSRVRLVQETKSTVDFGDTRASRVLGFGNIDSYDALEHTRELGLSGIPGPYFLFPTGGHTEKEEAIFVGIRRHEGENEVAYATSRARVKGI